MSSYTTIVVGTDGSASSFLAVERAAHMAAVFDALLVLGCAYYESNDEINAHIRRDSITVIGMDEAAENLTKAIEYATACGAKKVETAIRRGTPVEALMAIVNEYDADLLVVGNRGINSLTGRLLGSVPADVARQSDCDVMIVHTVTTDKSSDER
ncbi:putative stress related protein [Corynebacterium kutscheri]|uniref:Stress related protein n=1 Tax=Corynebacterium kutscheri TaxID=35755 RepID=A0A0F6R1L9_9CORY|nr:universal stress protein [Corynebacterium kutscheri]AKE41123.1 universal stress protein UspA-like protein [Corynebacterium kutscheri]VEH07031.1 putative stress related protein [Corynebacterium kutscheri]VEH09441.1 putative stress related protein [Corynebacterium kutscheri]VEH79527.1 putative stress related protein [Corynebacterium kutscheri]